MHCLSTRGQDSASITDALQRGLARDGGLYVPERLPRFTLADFADVETLPAITTRLLSPFFEHTTLADEISAICDKALNFPTPLVALRDEASFILELFHGPTAAFKDIGARFLAECLYRLRDPTAADVTVLAATSGDTGSAVAAAFHQRSGFRVVILFPDGRVSKRQAHLLSCFGGNVNTYAVQGNFDDCQTLVKAMFADNSLQIQHPLTSANSISLGRLLPQAGYYAYAAISHWRAHQQILNFVIPAGNLGNALAAVYARAMGLPIGEIVLGTNANRVLTDFLQSGNYAPKLSIATIANAMDVGAPSNIERLRVLFDSHAELVSALSAWPIDDGAIRHRIEHFNRDQDRVICPHTAVAAELLTRIRQSGDQRPWCIVATAHPAKFEAVVQPLIGYDLPLPAALSSWLQRPAIAHTLKADIGELRHILLKAD